ncbi:MAG: hypothetical protein C4526_00225 [Nitrospiraceae bacterium]|nr:MAG: hypothetical protein C4526_00225 [Nitrospiraceae bacterium]
MKITWKHCRSYDEAKDFSRIIYLHQWNDKPFYWGKAHNSFFGGHKRKKDNLHASGRYNAGYRHWIEGCLRHGGQLFVGQLDDEALANVDEVENYLIYTYGHEMNTKVETPKQVLNIEHAGEVPSSIKNAKTP